MAFSETLINQARAVAARYIGNMAGTAAAMRDPMQALERLANASEHVWSSRNMLVDLRNRGLLVTSDVKLFDIMRSNLYAAEVAMYTGLVSGLARAGVPTSTLQSFPRPVRIPALNEPVTRLRPGSVALQGLQGVARRGLKGPEAAAPAAAAAATPTILIWAAGIIALLVALALVGAVIGVVLAADQIAAIFVVEAQTEQLRVFYDARLAFYTGCLSTGTQTPAQCLALATAAVPPPIQVLPKPPGDLSGWVWAAAGAGVLTAIGLVTYLVRGSGTKLYKMR